MVCIFFFVITAYPSFSKSNGPTSCTIRANQSTLFAGNIDTLKHVKKDVMEMGKGTECGIGLEGFEDFEVDDQIQTYEEVRERRIL